MKTLRSLPPPDDARLRDALAILDEQAARETRLVERIAAAVIAALRPTVEPFAMLTVRECCDFFHVSRETLAHWERTGLLRPFRSGKVAIYDSRSVDTFVKRQQGMNDDVDVAA